MDRYTGMSGVPKPWRACSPCQGLGIDILASSEETDVPCGACHGTRRKSWRTSLVQLPMRLAKMASFLGREVIRAEFCAGYPHLSRQRMLSRRIALRAMLADFA